MGEHAPSFKPDAHDLLPSVTRLLGGDVRSVVVVEVGATLGGQSHEGTLGVHRVTGTALTASGPQPFSLVVKRMQPGADSRLRRQIARELRAYADPVLASRTASFRPARSYGQFEDAGGATVLCMEDLGAHRTAAWSDDDYRVAAAALGRYHGAGLGEDPAGGSWNGACALRNFAGVPEIVEAVEGLRAAPRGSAFSEGGTPAGVLERFLDVWDARLAAFALLDALPRVLAHGDVHCENLFLMRRERGSEEVAAIDWAYVGPGGVGEDLGSLVIAELVWRKMSLDRFRALEPLAFASYVRGLSEAGFHGDERLPRLGFVGMAVLDAGLRLLLILSRILPARPHGRDTTREVEAYAGILAGILPYLDEANALAHELFGAPLA